MPEPESWHQDTTAIRSGRAHSRDSLAPVLFPSTTYVVESVDDHRQLAGSTHPAKYYSRFGSPSVEEFEDAIAALEGAESALAFASGMAAVSALVFGLCSTGDHIVAQRQIFSVTSALLTMHCPRFGIDVTFVDGTDAEEIASAVRPGKTQLVFVETPANPRLDLVDLDAVGAIVGPITVCDATFATPVVQQPLRHGIDLVLHAATKGIAGHNDALLGAIAGNRDLIEPIWAFHAVSGAQASPFDAWNGLRGIRTLPTRVRQQSASAARIARFLEDHPRIELVSYPGLDSHPQRELAKRQMTSGGTVLTFEVAGGLEGGKAFADGCRLAQIALSLGGPETLVTHPATIVSHLTPDERAALGVADGMIRMSVGLEHVEDLIADIGQSLDALP